MLGTSFQTYSRKWWHTYHIHTVDGWNPANQLRLVVFPIIYRVSYIPGAAGFQPPTVPLLVNKTPKQQIQHFVPLPSHPAQQSFLRHYAPSSGKHICLKFITFEQISAGFIPWWNKKNIQNDRKSTPQFIRNAGSGIIPVNHHMRYSII